MQSVQNKETPDGGNHFLYLLTFVCTCIGVVIFLFATNLALDHMHPSVLRPDAELGWTFSGAIEQKLPDGTSYPLRYNDLGMRGAEVTNPVRVMFLGNSITMGAQLPEDEIFVGRLSAVNAGFDGYDSVQELNRYKRDLYQLQPKHLGIVIIGTDIATKDASAKKIKSALESNGEMVRYSFKRQLRNYTIGYRRIRNQLIESLFGVKVPPATEDIVAKDRYYFDSVAKPIDADAWKEWTEALLEIKKISPSTKIHLILTPPRRQAEMYKAGERSYWLNRNLADFARQHGFDFIDLLPTIGRMDSAQIYLDSCHYTSLGHRIVAEEIDRKIPKG